MKNYLMLLSFFSASFCYASTVKKTTPGAKPSPLKAKCIANFASCKAEKKALGKDPEGRELWVMQFDKVLPPKAKKKKSKTDDDDDSDENAEPCIPTEVELFHVRAGKVESHELVTTLRDGEDACSYGINGGGEEIEADASAQTITDTTDGGSNWAWMQTSKWKAVPKVEQITDDYHSFWKQGSTNTESHSDLKMKVTHVGWFAPDCKDFDKDTGGDDIASRTDYSFDEIPVNPKATSEWKKPEFELSGIKVNAAASAKNLREGGFVTFGKPGEADEANIEVLAIDKENYLVELTAKKAETAASWVNSDHLEVWISEKGNGEGAQCISMPTQDASEDNDRGTALDKPTQWGISSLDGKVTRGVGPKEISLEAERIDLKPAKGIHARFHVKTSSPVDAITFIYSMAEKGKQKRMIATSHFKFNDPRTIGKTERFGE